jgi:transcription elongation factor Elf1
VSTDQLNVTFQCPDCGGGVIELPDEHDDDSLAKCKDCGASFGRWGDVKAQAMEAAKAHVSDKFHDAFKGLKGWKVT